MGRGSIVIRFTKRGVDRPGGPYEVVHIYLRGIGKIFHARCEKSLVANMLEVLNGGVERSSTGKTFYLTGARAESVLRRLVVMMGCRQCVRDGSKILHIMEAVWEMDEYEALFWYSRMLDAYMERGLPGVCRVAKAFRLLHGIDKE